MSTFWKPIPAVGRGAAPGVHYKQLGSGLYELWCRCDLCFRSGRSVEFHMWERKEESGQLCDDCDGNVEARCGLLEEGWERLG